MSLSLVKDKTPSKMPLKKFLNFFVFNDFSYHEVKHNGNKKRVVLIFDLFHPELNLNEIECLKILNI